MLDRILFIRHGETEWNKQKKKQGRQDSELTSNGLRSARLLKTAELPFVPNYIFTSPLKRSMYFAEILEKRFQKSIVVDNNLAEHSFGIFEGFSNEDIENNAPGLLEKRRNDMWEFRWPGGESYSDLYIRGTKFLDKLRILNGSGFVVGHVMINKVILGNLLNLSHKDILFISQPHDCVYLWTLDSGVSYTNLNSKKKEWKKGYINK